MVGFKDGIVYIYCRDETRARQELAEINKIKPGHAQLKKLSDGKNGTYYNLVFPNTDADLSKRILEKLGADKNNQRIIKELYLQRVDQRAVVPMESANVGEINGFVGQLGRIGTRMFVSPESANKMEAELRMSEKLLAALNQRDGKTAAILLREFMDTLPDRDPRRASLTAAAGRFENMTSAQVEVLLNEKVIDSNWNKSTVGSMLNAIQPVTAARWIVKRESDEAIRIVNAQADRVSVAAQAAGIVGGVAASLPAGPAAAAAAAGSGSSAVGQRQPSHR
jgi:hypothetical protein